MRKDDAAELKRYGNGKMIEQVKLLRVLTHAAGCAVILVSVFLCGCNPRTSINADKEAAAYRKLAHAHREEDRHAEAVAAYKKVVAIKPDDGSAYLLMGNAYFELQEYAKAVGAYEKAIAIEPDLAVEYVYMAWAYEKLQEPAKAVAAYKKAVAVTPVPDSALEHAFRGMAHANLGQYAKAAAACEKAIAIRPDYARAYLCLGGAYHELDRYDDAIAAY